MGKGEGKTVIDSKTIGFLEKRSGDAELTFGQAIYANKRRQTRVVQGRRRSRIIEEPFVNV